LTGSVWTFENPSSFIFATAHATARGLASEPDMRGPTLSTSDAMWSSAFDEASVASRTRDAFDVSTGGAAGTTGVIGCVTTGRIGSRMNGRGGRSIGA